MKKPLVQSPIPQGSVAAPFNSLDAGAIQALAKGVANEGQQIRALNWILKGACADGLWPYRDNPRETDVGLGRNFVAQQIVGLMKVNISQLAKREDRGESEHG